MPPASCVSRHIAFPRWLVVVTLVMAFLFAPVAGAHAPRLQENVAQIKQSMAQNQQALAQYTLHEQQTISIQGQDCSSSTNRATSCWVRRALRAKFASSFSVTIICGQPQQAIQSLQIFSYLNAPSDAVTTTAQFACLPNGPNHVYDVLVNGVSNAFQDEITQTVDDKA